MNTAGFIVSCIIWLSLFGCAHHQGDVKKQSREVAETFEFVELIMASPARILIITDDQAHARRAARAAFDRMHEIERTLSSWSIHSESSRLVNSAPEQMPISEELRAVLELSQALHQQSNGAFDLTTGPCIELWRSARNRGTLPDAAELARARSMLGMEAIELTPPLARITTPGVTLNFGAIGKGEAVWQAAEILRGKGMKRFLIDFDGELRVEHAPPERAHWRIDIAGTPLTPALTLATSMKTISTSGDLNQFVEVDGIRYSHVIDPRNGLGCTTGRQVTVINNAPHGLADALATIGCVLETDRFEQLLTTHYPQTSAVILTRSDEETMVTLIGDPPVSVADAP